MRTLLIVIILFTCVQTWAQVNLVKNPSLEEYRRCPIGVDQIWLANCWSPIDTNLYTTWGDTSGQAYCSAEYCNACIPSGLDGSVPNALRFNHYPHTGNGMTQVQMYYNDTDATRYKRDYLQGRLKNVLIPGQSYCISFYVTLEQGSIFAINNIGAYLDDGTIDTAMNTCGEVQSQYTPQILDTSIINDTLKWIKIQGTYIATGNERFITIGNFTDMFHTNYVPRIGRDTTGWGDWHLPSGGYSWYLVDDVCIIKSETVANAGLDKIIPQGSSDSVKIGDTLESYLPVYWYKNGIKIDSNKASIKVHPDTTTKYVVSLDICGHITYDTVVVQVIDTAIHHEGFDNIEFKMSRVQVYPNPVQSTLTVVNAKGCDFTLYDCIGKIELHRNIQSDNEELNLQGVSMGFYYAQIHDQLTGRKRTIKLIKER